MSPTGFLTAGSGIPKKIREHMVEKRMLRGVISMPSNIFATTGTNVSILFIDSENKDGEIVLMDASKLGTKEKLDGKNQKTVLSIDEVNYIIETFVSKKAVPEFCVTTSYDAIVAKKYSISPGQFFEATIVYTEISHEEFLSKISTYRKMLNEMSNRSNELSSQIDSALAGLSYDL